MLKTLVTVALLLAAYAPFAHADQDHATIGSDIIVSEGQTAGDIACAFCSVHVHGDVKGDVAILFGSITVDSDHSISGDVAILGGDLNLAEEAQVGGDVAILGGSANLAPDATIHGDHTVFPQVVLLLPLLVLAGIIWLIVYLIRRNRYRFPAYPNGRGFPTR
jgi:hypothetical protein